ncbi:MAG TPA: hypothetical protein VJN50_04245 [Actinomycetota bacterium]|nr:hypothetical protein [Actinomycetota bacterium]
MLTIDHLMHDPGTESECEDCWRLAYEPSWYEHLRDVARDRDAHSTDVTVVPESQIVEHAE